MFRYEDFGSLQQYMNGSGKSTRTITGNLQRAGNAMDFPEAAARSGTMVCSVMTPSLLLTRHYDTALNSSRS
jgi:hypothetical protein